MRIVEGLEMVLVRCGLRQRVKYGRPWGELYDRRGGEMSRRGGPTPPAVSSLDREVAAIQDEVDWGELLLEWQHLGIAAVFF